MDRTSFDQGKSAEQFPFKSVKPIPLHWNFDITVGFRKQLRVRYPDFGYVKITMEWVWQGEQLGTFALVSSIHPSWYGVPSVSKTPSVSVAPPTPWKG